MEFLQVLASGNGKAMEMLSDSDARNALVALQQGAKLTPADIQSKTININGQAIALKIVRPQGAQGILPVFMPFHGGGWVLGDFHTHERLIRDLVNRSGAAAVYVDYTRSPEAHYPVAINQAFAATKWIAANGKKY